MGAKMSSYVKSITFLLAASLGIGAILAAWTGTGSFIISWLGCGLLLFICLTLMWASWRAAGGGRLLAWMVILAFALRLAAGLALEWGLPRFGYDEQNQKAGYVFADAYGRDHEALALARSGRSLGAAFSQEFVTDQYGGLLSLSALVYRALSPDAHRPYLILILTAGVAALGVPFFYSAVRRRWGGKTAALAGWVLALYPESILLGSSQMREPFLITFSVIAFWSVIAWPRRRAWVGGIASLAGLLLFSYRAAAPIIGLCAVWCLLEFTCRSKWVSHSDAAKGLPRRSIRWSWLLGLGVVLAGIGVAAASWAWLVGNFDWDSYQTMTNSYWMTYILGSLPPRLAEIGRLPFVVVYGMAQPVLPAAFLDPAPLIWQVIGVLRALGWYALAPFLIYSVLAALRSQGVTLRPQDVADRRILLWFSIVAVVWVVISSYRAGGSQWDNPRYRTMLLPWMAFLAGWSYTWARTRRDPWLLRFLAVEGVFLLFFSEWYVSRYTKLIPRLPFTVMVVVIIVLSLAILLGGWAWDRFRPKRSLT
jgi:hypothetical protein